MATQISACGGSEEEEEEDPLLYSVILPTYNERENLPVVVYLLHKTFTEMGAKYEVIVVDDASPDGTGEVAKKLGGTHFKVKLVSRSGKLGLGSAYREGLKVASGDYVVIMDADLSHHPKFIGYMAGIMAVSNCHIVTGTRYAPGGGVAGWDLRRKATSKGANILADFLLNPGVSDLTGSFRLYKRKVLEDILPNVTCTGYAFQMEIIVLARRFGYTVEEVPITFVDRMYGESKLGPREIIMYVKGLVTLFLTT
jgi:dolichol-phosphate mannosyltransferase